MMHVKRHKLVPPNLKKQTEKAEDCWKLGGSVASGHLLRAPLSGCRESADKLAKPDQEPNPTTT